MARSTNAPTGPPAGGPDRGPARTNPLEGCTALVLGADGRIGGAIAGALGAAGARLVLAARNGDRLAALQADLDAVGVRARAIPTDVTDDESVRALVVQAAADGMEVAVNNAGTTHRPAPLGSLPVAEADRVFRVTLRGTLLAMHHELAVLPTGGRVVNVASTAGLAGAPGMAAYVAAKHGVVGLTRTAALDHADRGIRVNAVAPGSIESGGLATQPQEIRDRVGSAAPLGRLGSADEVAAAVLWLASPASGYTTGTVLTVDGGKGARGA